ncbi:hypothetical protein PHLCEN_2v13129, partial [Hermanssonia centrifuga]
MMLKFVRFAICAFAWTALASAAALPNPKYQVNELVAYMGAGAPNIKHSPIGKIL